jgi:hypothetical protein
MRPGADPWRFVVHAVLRRVRAGSIEIDERYRGGEVRHFGPESAARRARIEVHDPRVSRRIARSKSIGFGQTWAERLWDTDDLPALLRIAARDIGRGDALRRRIAPLLVPFQRLATLRLLTTRRGARTNIAAHYDLGSDYRDLDGTYDKLVSLEMIEAVGWEWFDRFFRDCSRLLGPAGLFFLQSIVIADGAYEFERRTRSFANEVIFPGGCLPSVASIQSSIARETDLRTIALEDISASYVLTLRAWRERFEEASERLEELGYDERFQRTWRFYLAISEAGFAEARIRDVQMLFAKPHWSGRPRLAWDAAADRDAELAAEP